MNEINLKDILCYIIHKIYIPIILITISCGAGTYYSLCLKKPIYSTTASIILSSSGTAKVSQDDIAISKNLAQTFKEIGTSRQVLSKVIQELNLNKTHSELKDQIKISTNGETVITEIMVSTDNPNDAKNIANSVAKNLIEQINITYTIDNLRIFDEAIEPAESDNINLLKDELAYFTSGLILGIVIILAKLYCSDTEQELAKIQSKRVKISLK